VNAYYGTSSTLRSSSAQSKLVEQLVFDGSGRRLASAAQDGSLVVYRW
jgi:hypothetical protein